MPVATTSGASTQRFTLKTAPPDGFVVIRRMTFGEYLARRERVSMMHLKQTEKSKSMEGSMQLVSAEATMIEFGECIMEHNLTDENDQLLDFKRAKDVKRLDPRIGEEISTYISELNQFEEDEEEGN